MLAAGHILQISFNSSLQLQRYDLQMKVKSKFYVYD